jgi:hypothetical protein
MFNIHPPGAVKPSGVKGQEEDMEVISFFCKKCRWNTASQTFVADFDTNEKSMALINLRVLN